MEFLTLALILSDLVCTIVFVFCLFHLLRWALSRVSDWRVSQGKRPWSSRLCFLLSLLAALSFVL